MSIPLENVRVKFGIDRHNLGYLVTAEVYVSRLLNREEFIAHCNRYKTQEAILDKLE